MSIDRVAMVYAGSAARIALVIGLALALTKLVNSLIRSLFEHYGKPNGAKLDEQRRRTLLSLLTSTVKYIMGGIALVTILEILNIDTKPILGGAAVLGLAVGFGAQSLVKDVITGFFIIYERQYDIGDYISVAGVSGVVEELGFRATRLRDFSGEVHIIPNSLVTITTNRSREGSRALIEVTIAYEEDVRRAMNAIQQVCDEFARESKVILEGPRVLGISRLDQYGVTFQVWAKSKPLEQWGVERELRLRIKEGLDRAHIEVPGPRMILVDRPAAMSETGFVRGDAGESASQAKQDTGADPCS